MINLIHAELFKLRKCKAFKISLLLTTICSVALMAISYGNATGKCNISSGNASGLSDIFIMSVIGTLMAGIIICGDFENKDIHDEISCGRLEIVISKSVIYSLIIIALVLPYAVVGFAGFLSGADFDRMFKFSVFLNVMANDQHLSLNTTNIVKALLVVLTSVVVYAARLSFCIPVAFKMRKSVIVTVIGVVFGFIINLVLSGLEKIRFFKQIEKLLPYSYAKLELTDSSMYLLRALLVSGFFIGIMIVISYLLFRKSEIK